MPVIGTAGHVDHGKSSLIEALTGTHPDRLPEERERGMTIDLGFAHFGGRGGEPIGVIDVPGHERFIRNMVAGAWALDLAVLAVAADDGWMRQSEDHTRVLACMGVKRLILAVTKSDIAGAERVEEVTRDAARHCARLGFPAAPSIAVSARTGENIEALRELIVRQLEGAVFELDFGPGPGLPLMFIDRVFTVKGSGVVVTGTLKGGPVERNAELHLLPARRAVRVRGLQSYYRELDQAQPGSRVALNLHGVEAGELHRGDCLTAPRGRCWVEPEFVIRLAGDADPALKNHAEIEAALGTGHRIARFHKLDEHGLARILFAEPSALFWNQPCLLIRHGGSGILASCRVVWPEAVPKARRALLSEALRALPDPLHARDFARLKLGVEGWIRREELPSEAGGPAGAVERGNMLFRPEALELLERGIERLASRPGGVHPEELRGKLGVQPDVAEAAVEDLRRRGRLTLRSGLLFAHSDPERALSPMGRKLLADLRAAATQGLEPHKLKIAGARKQLAILARSGLAVSLGSGAGTIYYPIETYRDLVKAILSDRGIGALIELAEAKAATGLSRKYLIPLLNRMETEGLVKREGDARRLIRRPD